MIIKTKDFFSLKQTAEKLNLSKEGVRFLINKNELTPVYKVDSYFIIPKKTIDTFKKNRKKRHISDRRYKVK